MSDVMRLVLSGVVRDFVENGATRSRRLFSAEDIDGDDPVELPPGKAVMVEFSYVSEGHLRTTPKVTDVTED